MQYRSGPALGYTFEEARALGLQSASKGRAHYLKYVAAHANLVRGLKAHVMIVDDHEEPEERFKGTLTLRTFSKIRGAVNRCILKAQGKPWTDTRGRVYQPQAHQTNSKVPMKKEKR